MGTHSYLEPTKVGGLRWMGVLELENPKVAINIRWWGFDLDVMKFALLLVVDSSYDDDDSSMCDTADSSRCNTEPENSK